MQMQLHPEDCAARLCQWRFRCRCDLSPSPLRTAREQPLQPPDSAQFRHQRQQVWHKPHPEGHLRLHPHLLQALPSAHAAST